MPYNLSNITKENLIAAISVTLPNKWDKKEIPDQYWFVHNGMYFSLRSVIKMAYMFTGHIMPLKHPILNNNQSWIEAMANRGFQITYRNDHWFSERSNFWIGGTTYGSDKKPIPMLNDFLKEGFWGTDHISTTKEGTRILSLLKKMQPNDRIALRKFNRNTGIIKIQAIGTITDISEAKNGKVKVIWDINPPLFEGKKPSGSGTGNWWSTLLQLNHIEDIWHLFQEGNQECRLARVTWNTNGWLFPSGSVGKSEDTELHEGKVHYGGEEWLLDTDKLIDGYHYGFLQPIRKTQKSFLNKYFQVHLYTINNTNGSRFYLGYIDELEAIRELTAAEIKHRYVSQNWLKELKSQLAAVNASTKGFDDKAGIDLFNVRFQPKNLHLLRQPINIPNDHPFHRYTRYVFTKITASMADNFQEIVPKAIFKPSPLVTIDDLDFPEISPKPLVPRLFQNQMMHERMSLHLTNHLQRKYPGRVSRESDAGYDAKRVDIIVKDDDGQMIYFEIKTYNNIMSCIREAIGQLMEYSLYPDQYRAKSWNIVTPWALTVEAEIYLQQLREHYKLPFNYCQFSIKTDTLKYTF